jgi:HK97 family phage portal protein
MQRDQLRDDIHRLYEGSKNAGRILMMEGDFAWQDMGLSPKDLDFIAGKSVSAREICQAFGVPPILAGIPGDATFANYREARFHLWEDTILPLLDYLVAEFNLWLTPFYGDNLRLGYDVDGIAALSPKREATWAKICASDFLTINEKRQAVGYSPIDGGERLNIRGLNGTED